MKAIKWLLAAMLVLGLMPGTAGAQTLKVKYPNGGEIFPLNETRPITWSSDKLSTNIKILLVDKNLNKTFVIEDSYTISPEWAYNWKVGQVKSGGAVPPGNNYVIRLQTVDGKYADESDNYFSIRSAKKLKITNPTALNSWNLNSSKLITWENPGNLSGTVNLVLATPPPSSFFLIAQNIPVGNLKYPWVVGKILNSPQAVPPGKYAIVILSSNNQDADISGWFTISSASTHLLTPSIYNYWWFNRYRWECFDTLDTKGVAPDDPPPGTMRIGFDNSYDSGFCYKSYLGHAYRGYLKFDLSQIKGNLVKAKLLLTIKSTVRWTGDTASNVGCCAGSIRIVDAPISGFDTKEHLYDHIPQYQGTTAKVKYDGGKNLEIDVTSVVKNWLAGAPNYGFMFIGPNENYNHNNDRCVTIFSPIVLSLEMEPTI